MLKRSLAALALASAVLALGTALEVVLALRREYLPTEPVLVIGGMFGDEDGRPLHLAVLGDSTAAGVGAGDADDAYPTLLARRLAQRGFLVRLTALGVSGARISDVVDEQLREALAEDPDVVVVGVGANDVTHATGLGAVRDGIDELCRAFRDDGVKLLLVGVPDMRAAAFYEPLRSVAGWRGRRVTDAIEDAAEPHGITVVPLAEKTASFFAAAPEEHYSDDLFHPGPGGYRRWADAIFPHLLEVVE